MPRSSVPFIAASGDIDSIKVGVAGYERQATAADVRSITGAMGISVAHYGATGTGNETTEFQAAIDALPAAGGAIYLESGIDYTVTIGSLSVGSKRVLWVGTDNTVNTAEVWGLPGIQDSFAADTGLGRNIYNVENGAALDGSYKDNRRNADYTGGSGGQLDYVERWENIIASTVGSSGNRKAEKGGIFTVTNNSDYANGVALQVNAEADGQGAVWGLEVSTQANEVPVTFAQRGIEVAISATGADANNLRRVIDVISHSSDAVTYSATDSVHVGVNVEAGTCDFDYGIKIYDSPDNASTIHNAALYINTAATNLIHAVAEGQAGVIRYGSDQDGAANIAAALYGVGHDSVGNENVYTQIRTVINDPTNGSEDGSFQFYTQTAGTLTRKMSITNNGTNPIELYVGGSLKSVTEGATDSGGTGFKVLRVPN